MMDERSIKTIKVFHGIISDMSSVVEDLREKEKEYEELIKYNETLLEENETFKQELETLKKKYYFGNLTSYFLVISLSMFLAFPPSM